MSETCRFIVKAASKPGEEPNRCGKPTVVLTDYCDRHQALSTIGEVLTWVDVSSTEGVSLGELGSGGDPKKTL
jgi:hypothetical protein